MNRLGKILTLGLEKKRAWQLPIIAALLVLFGLGVRWWYNWVAVRGIRLLDMVDINDIEDRLEKLAIVYVWPWLARNPGLACGLNAGCFLLLIVLLWPVIIRVYRRLVVKERV